MKQIILKNRNTTLKMTDIALGAGQLGNEGCSAECFKILDYYIGAGGNCLDVARSYAGGACEQELGSYLHMRNCRQQVLISSKGGFPLDRAEMHLSRLSQKELTDDLEASLKALGTHYIDIYFLHRDDVNIPVEDIMPILDKFVKAGKVLTLGASNWTAGRIGMANRFAEENNLTPFSASQINWSLAVTTPPLTGDLTHIVMNDIEYSWYKENAFPVMAYSAQAKGFFAKVFDGRPQKTSAERSYTPLAVNFQRAQRLKALAEELQVPMSSLLLDYIRSKDIPSAAIGGFTTAEQAAECLAYTGSALTEAQLTYLEWGNS